MERGYLDVGVSQVGTGFFSAEVGWALSLVGTRWEMALSKAGFSPCLRDGSSPWAASVSPSP